MMKRVTGMAGTPTIMYPNRDHRPPIGPIQGRVTTIRETQISPIGIIAWKGPMGMVTRGVLLGMGVILNRIIIGVIQIEGIIIRGVLLGMGVILNRIMGVHNKDIIQGQITGSRGSSMEIKTFMYGIPSSQNMMGRFCGGLMK